MSYQSKNRLFDLLSQTNYETFASDLEWVDLEQGYILHAPGEVIENVYFPLSCLISITTTMKDGKTSETGVVGNREVAGINAFMGERESTQTEYIVQVAGEAIKMKASNFRHVFEENKELRHVLLRYTQAFIAQLCQTTACNRLHTVDRRLARWLLEAQDRLDTNDLRLTQEFIAQMLGTRRSGVTQSAQKLQEDNVITYTRGHIKVLDQQGLEEAACECFMVVREEYDRLLGTKTRG